MAVLRLDAVRNLKNGGSEVASRGAPPVRSKYDQESNASRYSLA